MAPIFVLLEVVFLLGGKKRLHKVRRGGREGRRGRGRDGWRTDREMEDFGA
jgi:uncharacterized membrane protein YGL010W